MLHSSGLSAVWTREEDTITNVTWDLAEDAATLKSVCVCAFGADPMPFLRRMLPYLDVLLQYVGEESGKKKNILKNPLKRQFMKKNKTTEGTRILLHLLGKKCLGDLVSFSDTICGISCLLPNYCPHLRLFVCFCVFSAYPISVCPLPTSCSTLQQL